MKSVLILSSSPRRDGNSAALAKSAARGLERAGHRADFVYVDDVVRRFVGDCRQCRRPDGSCGIADGFARVFLEKFLPSEGLIAATPIYWYGMSAQLKAFLDRSFCYVAKSYPGSDAVARGMSGKRVGLLLSSEETYPAVSAGIVAQMQEYVRYTRSTFVGLVHGHGNARGEVARDPADPVAAAERFGTAFFSAHATDYQIDTPRPGRVWE